MVSFPLCFYLHLTNTWNQYLGWFLFLLTSMYPQFAHRYKQYILFPFPDLPPSKGLVLKWCSKAVYGFGQENTEGKVLSSVVLSLQLGKSLLFWPGWIFSSVSFHSWWMTQTSLTCLLQEPQQCPLHSLWTSAQRYLAVEHLDTVIVPHGSCVIVVQKWGNFIPSVSCLEHFHKAMIKRSGGQVERNSSRK